MDDLLPGFATASQLSKPGRQLSGFDLYKDGQKSLLQSVQEFGKMTLSERQPLAKLIYHL